MTKLDDKVQKLYLEDASQKQHDRNVPPKLSKVIQNRLIVSNSSQHKQAEHFSLIFSDCPVFAEIPRPERRGAIPTFSLATEGSKEAVSLQTFPGEMTHWLCGFQSLLNSVFCFSKSTCPCCFTWRAAQVSLSMLLRRGI